MEKPDVDSIEGLSPAISIDQKTTSRNPRSTVGTVTEIYDYLRLLWSRIGKPHCPSCGEPIAGQSLEQITDRVMTLRGRHPLHGPGAGRPRAQGRVRADARGDAPAGLRPARSSTASCVRLDEDDRPRQEAQARHLDRGRPPGHEGGNPQAPRGVGRGGLPARRGARRGRAARRRRSSGADAAGRAGKRGEVLFSEKFACLECGDLDARARAADLLLQLAPRRAASAATASASSG